MWDEEEGGQGHLVPKTLHFCPAGSLRSAPLRLPWALAGVGLMADVSWLEIPLPSHQGLENKSSHRRKKTSCSAPSEKARVSTTQPVKSLAVGWWPRGSRGQGAAGRKA